MVRQAREGRRRSGRGAAQHRPWVNPALHAQLLSSRNAAPAIGPVGPPIVARGESAAGGRNPSFQTAPSRPRPEDGRSPRPLARPAASRGSLIRALDDPAGTTASAGPASAARLDVATSLAAQISPADPLIPLHRFITVYSHLYAGAFDGARRPAEQPRCQSVLSLFARTPGRSTSRFSFFSSAQAGQRKDRLVFVVIPNR